MAAPLCGLVLGAACAGRNKDTRPEVKDLAIEGNDALSGRTIKKRILTAETPVWPWSKPRAFDRIAWETDLRRIERLYNAEGYYQAKVGGQVKTPSEREVELEIQVAEGAPTRVDALTLEGLDVLSPDERAFVTEELPLAAGVVFREARWQALKESVQRRLRDRGYAEAQIEGEALVDVTTQRVRLNVFVNPGPLYRFGKVEVKQPQGAQVRPEWIADQVRLDLKEGEIFSQEALDEAQRRVFGMNVFAVARVGTGTPEVAAARMPVQVETQEAPFRTLRFGGGLGVDQIRNEVRLFSGWTHRNFLGGLRELEARARVGYALIPSAIAAFRNQSTDAPRRGFVYLTGLDFEQPRLFGAPQLRYQAAIDSERQLEQAYTSIEGRFKTGVAWRPFVDLSLRPSYQISVSRLDAPDFVTPDLAARTLGCSENPCVVTLSFLEQMLSYDRRDDPLDPQTGHFESVSFQEGGGPLGGSFDYLRVMGDARYYLTPTFLEDFTFAVRGSAGAIFPLSGDESDTPIQQRFYAGGGVSMRGFNARRLAPLLEVFPTDPTDEPVTLPIGGNGLLLASGEVRYRTSGILTLAGFLDGGNVTRERPTISDVRDMLWAVGGGIRIKTPIGPVRLDLAWRLPVGEMPTVVNGMASYEEDRSCFGIGGNRGDYRRDGACTLHLSIGEAF